MVTAAAPPRFGIIGAWSCFVLHVFAMAALLEVRIRGDRWLKRPLHRSSEALAGEESETARIAAEGSLDPSRRVVEEALLAGSRGEMT